MTAVKVLARYIWLAFWPAKLSSDYLYSEIPLSRWSPEDWISWLTAGVAVALPASNLFFPTGTTMAERLTYLPLVGPLAAVAIAVDVRGAYRWSEFA